MAIVGKGFEGAGARWVRSAILLAAMTAIPTVTLAAQYTFAVEPAYPAEQTQAIYKPLLSYLSKATGEQFTLVTSKNYHFYWRDIRAGSSSDFAYDEAHLADYRIGHSQYVPLVRAAGNTSYSLVANPDVASKGLSALIGHRVATMAAPSLGYAVLLSFYPDPLRQPEIQSSAASWKDAIESVFGEEADAAILPNWLRVQYPNLTVMKTSREFPGATVMAAASVPVDVRQKVMDALLKLHEDPALYDVLNQLGISKFVAADAAEFHGTEQMLKEFYGYQ
jgi:ABC-type phosphate/phosphonate transport system substrate-binding protein